MPLHKCSQLLSLFTVTGFALQLWGEGGVQGSFGGDLALPGVNRGHRAGCTDSRKGRGAELAKTLLGEEILSIIRERKSWIKSLQLVTVLGLQH